MKESEQDKANKGYVRVGAYRKVGKTTYYSGWSKTKTMKTNIEKREGREYRIKIKAALCSGSMPENRGLLSFMEYRFISHS